MTDNDAVLFTGRAYKEHQAFWKQKLSAVREGFRFEDAAARAGARAEGRASRVCLLTPEAQGVVSSLSGGQPLGAFVVILSALAAVVSKFGDKRTVALKSPAYAGGGATPEAPAPEEVVLVEEVYGEMTLRQLLVGVRETVSRSYRFQNFPLRLLFGEEELKSKTGGNVAVHFAPIHGPRRASARHDLLCEMEECEGGLRLKFDYDASVFGGHFIGSFADACGQALASFARPDARLRELDFLSPEERERLVSGLNRTRSDSPREATIHELFEAQAERTPDAPALICEGRLLSYREVNEAANRLAHHLRGECGVGADGRVGLMLNRSERTVIG